MDRDVTALVRFARRRGLSPTCTGIVADRTQPAVARERALARIVSAIAEIEPPPPTAERVA